VINGTLHITAHHLIFSFLPKSPPSEDATEAPKPRPQETWICFPMIQYCTFRPTLPNSAQRSSIRIRGRDFSYVSFQLADDVKARDVYESIKSLTAKVGKIEKLCAFSYRPHGAEKDVNGWSIYNAQKEWERLGVTKENSGWRVSNINADYKVRLFTCTCLQTCSFPISVPLTI
jgi:myotubularin-related protein 6/7/8